MSWIYEIGPGSEMIAEERKRQISEEGHTCDRDDMKVNGELALAGALIASPITLYEREKIPMYSFVDPWPQTINYMEPVRIPISIVDEDEGLIVKRIRHLTIAGALIAAEIDRYTRILQREG